MPPHLPLTDIFTITAYGCFLLNKVWRNTTHVVFLLVFLPYNTSNTYTFNISRVLNLLLILHLLFYHIDLLPVDFIPILDTKVISSSFARRKYGCSCEHPCSDSKNGRTVHLAMKDNPRLINFPLRDSEEWKKEFNARTSVERSNKREKIDFKLESGKHRSSKMWYCHLYHILMLQHLDAWDLPVFTFQSSAPVLTGHNHSELRAII